MSPHYLLGRGQANMEDLTITIPQVKFPTCMGEDSCSNTLIPQSPPVTASSSCTVFTTQGQVKSYQYGANISSQIPPYVPGEHIRCIIAIYYNFPNQQSHGVVCDWSCTCILMYFCQPWIHTQTGHQILCTPCSCTSSPCCHCPDLPDLPWGGQGLVAAR